MPFTTVVSVSSCQLSALEGCSEDELSVESQIQATCFNFDWHFILPVQFFLSALWFLQIGSNIEGKWDVNTQLNLLLLWNYSVLSRAWHFWLLRKITVFAGKRLEILNVETAGSGDQDAWEKSPGRAARRGQQEGRLRPLGRAWFAASWVRPPWISILHWNARQNSRVSLQEVVCSESDMLLHKNPLRCRTTK